MGMKVELNEEQVRLKNEFLEFSEKEIAPYAEEHDREEKLKTEVIETLKESGYLGGLLPKKYGGLNLDMVSLGILNEEIGKGCGSVRTLLTVHGMVSLGILRWGTDAQKEYWLPKLSKGEIIGAFGLSEENVGSDAKSIETEATFNNGHYTLNGIKKWITMGQIADVFLIYASVEGQPTAFLVERDTQGFSIEPMHGLLGTRGAMIAKLHMSDCKIPKENLVGLHGSGLSHVGLTCLDYGRYTVAWGCIGTAQACLEKSIDYANKREQFGSPIADNQLVQKMITEMITEIKAARLLCYRAGYLKEISDPESILETWVAKYFSSKMVNRVASNAVQIHGGNGCYKEYGIERLFRDAKINEIIEGTTQIHEVLIAKNFSI